LDKIAYKKSIYEKVKNFRRNLDVNRVIGENVTGRNMKKIRDKFPYLSKKILDRYNPSSIDRMVGAATKGAAIKGAIGAVKGGAKSFKKALIKETPALKKVIKKKNKLKKALGKKLKKNTPNYIQKKNKLIGASVGSAAIGAGLGAGVGALRKKD
jgi:hypothetical protein